MLKVELLEVAGFEPALHGMRNPMNSWDKSDSILTSKCEYPDLDCSNHENECGVCVGNNDLKLMQTLTKAGTEHRKFLRMIQVYVNIVAPLYWWKEFDTYKIGTVANSCSTMHKIHAKEFTLDDFSFEKIEGKGFLLDLIKVLNVNREEYLETKDRKHWDLMIQLLPSSYNQKRTVMINYETVLNIIRQRSNHKLDEWHVLCDFLHELPYVDYLIGGDSHE